MKILYICPYIPNETKIRSWNIIQRLGKNHSITLIALAQGYNTVDDTINRYCEKVSIIPLSRFFAYFSSFKALFTYIPLRVGYVQSKEMQNTVSKYIHSNMYDLIILDRIRSAQYVNISTTIPLYLDITDSMSLWYQSRYSYEKNIFRKFLWITESLKEKIYEEKVSCRFSKMFICSPVDYKHIQSHMCCENIHMIRNGVDLDKFPYIGFSKQSNIIIFHGNMDYFPNIEGILHFIKKIWPIILSKCHDAKLLIVGRYPITKISKLQCENIIVTGMVPDITEYLGKASVSICPVRIGAGTQNKVVEAMAVGIPVVATPFAVQGLETIDGQDLFIGETDNEFADKVVYLFQNPDIREQISISARSYVERVHDWNKIIDQLDNIMTHDVKKE